MTVTLANGLRFAFRPIMPQDKRALAVGLTFLGEETVHRRFLTSKTSFSRAELRYLTEVDGHGHVALVATPASDPELVVGVGRFIRDTDDLRTAEVAVVIADHLQGQGLGTALGLALADRAREEGVQHFTATMLGDNPAAHRLLERLAARVRAEPIVAGSHDLVADIAA